MPHDPNIVLEVGQVWIYDSSNNGKIEYRITNVYKCSGYSEAYADKYREGKLICTSCFIGYLNQNGMPDHWIERWSCIGFRKFSKVNPKTLRKQARDQVAATALTHRLTDERSKS